MDSSFTPIEQMLKFRASRYADFPYQEILLTRLCMHMQGYPLALGAAATLVLAVGLLVVTLRDLRRGAPAENHAETTVE